MQIVDIQSRVHSFSTKVFGPRAFEGPLAALADNPASIRFHRWRGRSGERYTSTIYPIDHDNPSAGLPDLGPAVLIAVAHHGARRHVTGTLAIERDSDWARGTARLHGGADEWHVHLLAPDRAARAAVLADLAPIRHMASVA